MSRCDDDSDWEAPEDPDDDDAESLTTICPSCGADVYEDAEQCPACGDYITHSARAWDGKPLWWVILGVLGIIAFIVMLTRGL